MLRTGDKIQVLATALFVTGCVVSLIVGVLMLGTFTFVGIVIMVVGVTLSMVTGAILNGFGELINQSAETNRRLEDIADTLDRLTIREVKTSGEIDPNSKPL